MVDVDLPGGSAILVEETVAVRKSILAVLAAAVLLASVPMASAQTAGGKAKPVAVISIASFDEWMGDIGFLGGLAGKADLATQADGMIKIFANDLKGMDKSKPLGAVVSMGEGPQALVFVPVTDLKDLLASIAGVTKQEAKDEGGGVFSMNAGPQKIFIKQKGDWAFVAQSVDQFADVPADPTTLLDGLKQGVRRRSPRLHPKHSRSDAPDGHRRSQGPVPHVAWATRRTKILKSAKSCSRSKSSSSKWSLTKPTKSPSAGTSMPRPSAPTWTSL